MFFYWPHAMDEESANALLEDIDFHHNKMKCSKIGMIQRVK